MVKVKQKIFLPGRIQRTYLPECHLVHGIRRRRPWLVVLVIPMFLTAKPKEHMFQLLQSSTFKAQPTCSLKVSFLSPACHKAIPIFQGVTIRVIIHMHCLRVENFPFSTQFYFTAPSQGPS